MSFQASTTFTRALLTGVFIGFFDTLLCLIYNIVYRDATGYIPSAIINVSSIIFAVNLLFMIIGMIYFMFTRAFGRRDVVFDLFFTLTTLFLIWRTEAGHRFTDQLVNSEFKGLMLGIILIIAVGIISIPLFYRSRLVEKYIM